MVGGGVPASGLRQQARRGHPVRIAVSQRVVVDPATGERRDALDQRWVSLLQAAGAITLPVPNHPSSLAHFLAAVAPDGILLTGGNDLASLGGDAPERDETENALISHALKTGLPLLGVCRGMQMLQTRFGVRLVRVEGHVAPTQTIVFDGNRIAVNSYHCWGSRETAEGLVVCGLSDDGIVKAVRSVRGRLMGIMWHPERTAPPRVEDIALLREFFGP
jgi:putative glutamine amidotransferase